MSTAVISTLIPESSEPTAAIERYEDAYRAAEKAIAFCDTVKRGGIFAGGVVFVAAMVTFQLSPAERSGFPVISVLLIAFAVWLVLISQVVGTGFHVMGRLLKAAVDSGVNSSPFLSNAQRAKAMSLRKGPAIPESILTRTA
jgi:hypothetical protein